MHGAYSVKYQNNVVLKVFTYELTLLNINFPFLPTFLMLYFIFTRNPVCKFPVCY
jgi:hypothetical protein